MRGIGMPKGSETQGPGLPLEAELPWPLAALAAASSFEPLPYCDKLDGYAAHGQPATSGDRLDAPFSRGLHAIRAAAVSARFPPSPRRLLAPALLDSRCFLGAVIGHHSRRAHLLAVRRT